jgi:RNA recognition motif-containing protein
MAFESRYRDRRTLSPRAQPLRMHPYGSNDYSGPPKPRHAPAQVAPNNVLGVFGLSIRTRERDLEDEFSRYGDVEKVVIVYDQRVSTVMVLICSG